MDLHYSLTQEDYTAFNLYHYQNDKALGPQTSRIGIWIMAIVLVIMLYIFKAPTMAALLVSAIVMIVWFVLAPKVYRLQVTRRLEKQIQQGTFTPLIGQRTLTLLDKGLTLTNPQQTREYDYSQILAIKKDDQRLYLYTGAESALIVPFSAFANEEQRQAFVKTLKEKNTPAPEMV